MKKYMVQIVLLATISRAVGDLGTCSICSCHDAVINCRNQRLNQSLDEASWLALDKSQYKTAIFDFNHIGHVIRLPKLSLVKLSYRNNRIVKIDDRAFKNLTSLEELILSENEITSNNLLPSVFEGPYDAEYYEPLKLRILDLSSNELHTLHQDLFEHLPFLERLYLKQNPFKILDKPTVIAISSLPNLQASLICLRKSSNDLITLRLARSVLSNVALSDPLFGNLAKSTQVLDLSFTKIKELPMGFLHTPKKLHELVLKGNLFKEVPIDVLAESHDLRILNLNENPIKVISSERPFPDIPTLKQLHISFMPNLTRIEEGSLSNLIALDYLYCRMNEKLSYISPLAFSRNDSKQRPNIVKIDLSDNALRYLDEELLKPVWNNIKHINIVGNPWVCDCENQWIVTRLIPLMMNISSAVDGLECAEPSAMKGQRLVNLYSKNYSMRCLDLYGNHPENDGPILISIFVIVILTLIIMLIVVIWLKNNNTCRQGGRVNYHRAFYRPTKLEDPDKY